MKIILIIISALAACLSALLTFFAVVMLNGGGLGRTTPEDASICAAFTLLNFAVLVSLAFCSKPWKPVIYMLGILDFGYGASSIIPSVIRPEFVFLGFVLCIKGALAMSYVSRLTTTPTE